MTHDSYDSSDAGFGAPPMVAHDPSGAPPFPPPDSTWPKAIGIISLVYASLGLLCGGGVGAAGLAFAPMRRSMAEAQGADIPTLPEWVVAMQVLMVLVTFVLGIYMVVGAIQLMRRRASGATHLRLWALARLVWMVIAMTGNLLAMKDLVAQEFAIQEATSPAGMPIDEDAMRVFMLGMLVASAVIASIYPVFLAFYLSTAKRRAELETWA